MVSAENLTIFHGKKPFMEKLSFQIPKGSVTALVGACGSGKTTLLHALAGIGRYKGNLQIHGRTAKGSLWGRGRTAKESLQANGRTGLVFQNPRFQFLGQTVEEEILMTLEATERGRRKPDKREMTANSKETGQRWQTDGTGSDQKRQTDRTGPGQEKQADAAVGNPSAQIQQKESILTRKAHELLAGFGLLPYIKDSPYALSQGQQRRLALLAMLVCDCSLMLLDEPTYAQDEQATRFILTLLEQQVAQGLTVIMATHDLALAEAFADQVFLVDKGNVRELSACELQEYMHRAMPGHASDCLPVNGVRNFREGTCCNTPEGGNAK